MTRTEQTARKYRMAAKLKNQELAGQPAASLLPRLKAVRCACLSTELPMNTGPTVIFMPVRAIVNRICSFSTRRQSLNFFAFAPLK